MVQGNESERYAHWALLPPFPFLCRPSKGAMSQAVMQARPYGSAAVALSAPLTSAGRVPPPRPPPTLAAAVAPAIHNRQSIRSPRARAVLAEQAERAGVVVHALQEHRALHALPQCARLAGLQKRKVGAGQRQPRQLLVAAAAAGRQARGTCASRPGCATAGGGPAGAAPLQARARAPSCDTRPRSPEAKGRCSDRILSRQRGCKHARVIGTQHHGMA